MTELSPEARALIESVGHGDGPDPERRARLERRLAASAAAVGTTLGIAKAAAAASGKAGLSAGAAAAAPLTATAAAVGLWMSVGAGVGGVTVAAISQLTAPAAVETLARARPQPRAPQPRAERLTASSAPRAEPPPNAPAASELAAARPSTAARKPNAPAAAELDMAPAAPVALPLSSDVSLEARSLEAARRELATGRALEALNLLTQHEQKFPSGVLREERLALTTVALCHLGRREEARQIAEAFLRAAPRSPLVPRLRETCAFSGAVQK